METLPKQFLSSLRILFDILDENRTGLIRLQDIESRWSDDGVRGLPPGVVEGLRKVTPPNGLLSFDRFVAGLKLVLVKRRDDIGIDNRKPLASKENQFIPSYPNEKLPFQRSQMYNQSSEPDHQNYNRLQRQANTTSNARDDVVNQYMPNRPRQGERINIMAKRFDQPRHHSDSQEMPGNIPSPIQHASSPSYILSARENSASTCHRGNPDSQQQPPFKAGQNQASFRRPMGRDPEQQPGRPPAVPPRTDRGPRVSLQQSQMRKSQSGPDLSSQLNSPPAVPPRHVSSHVIADLKNWQAGWQGQGHQQNQRNQQASRRGDSASPTNRNSDRDNAIYANLDEFRAKVPTQQQPTKVNQPQPVQSPSAQPTGPQRATVRRHGSGRRHTLSNGIDQNMLRRMKQLEEETSILRAGMGMLDSARDWYKKQLNSVADKQAMLGKVSYNDNSVEAHQERMNFQRARIAEVNQHLQTLIDSSEKGFPLHMNLAMSSRLRLGPAGSGHLDAASAKELQSLREQNRQLQQEMGQHREQLGQLEREKASLVRDLFEARAKNRPSHDDTTFM
ncbi:suppressor APC domain-containing protein 2-like [Elysia marginata]|uniref:Suppressor APC domain-containing protein 2-like n=1 Tax=Elysia marginata TaxID=1093978 RepID=A0AAV4JJF2_9GAST|nr:suppressor APC domain-containing protein 2-like [Elysia marginata]